MMGLIDWDAIVDRTREVHEESHWNSPMEIVTAAAKGYAIDTRSDQPVYIEVWVEKEAMAGVVGKICRELDVPYFCCRGYVSATAMREAALRIYHASEDRDSLVLHLGDHDPSGIDMSRDIADRLKVFEAGYNFHLERIALNMDQIDDYGPPPNPAKVTDSRFRVYQEDYGDDSWELDALAPSVIHDLIWEHVDAVTDDSLRTDRINHQEEDRLVLEDAAEEMRENT